MNFLFPTDRKMTQFHLNDAAKHGRYDFSHCDLSNLDLRVLGTYQKNGTITETLRFDFANLMDCIFEGLNLRSVVFEETYLGGARFVQADLTDARFRNVDLRCAVFFESCLEKTLFARANCTGTRFRFNEMKNTSFKDCYFLNSDFSFGDLYAEKSEKTTYHQREMNVFFLKNDFVHTNFEGCQLSNTDFLSMDFQSVNFKNAVLKNTTFKKCRLINCDFSNADLEGADFSTSYFVKNNLENANLKDTKMPKEFQSDQKGVEA